MDKGRKVPFSICFHSSLKGLSPEELRLSPSCPFKVCKVGDFEKEPRFGSEIRLLQEH